MKYEEFNKNIIKLIGGKDNIVSVTHCVTRLRFKLRDKGLAKTAELKELDGVIDVISNDVAYQVVIGTHVTDVYEELTSVLDLNTDSATGGHEKKSFGGYIQGALSAIAETINPFIDILMAAGVISAFLSILNIAGILSAESTTYIIFDSIRAGIFNFLPVLVAAGYAKREKVSPYLAMAMAFALVVPTIDGVEGLKLFGISLQTVTYSNSFIPALLGAWALCRIVKILNRIIPKSLQYFLVPGLSLAITLPIVLLVFGPIGNVIAEGMNVFFNYIFNVSNVIAIVCYAACHPFIMVTGAGSFTVPITLNFLTEFGYDPALLPAGLIADIGIAGAVVGYFLRARRQLKQENTSEKKKEAELFATTSFSALMGITEPALYGVFMKYRRPFIATLVGACSGGVIAGLAGVKTYGYVWGLMSIPTYLTGGVSNFIWMIVALCVSFIVSAIVAYGIGIPGNDKKEQSVKTISPEMDKTLKKVSIYPMTEGETIPLSAVADQAFASGALGKGIAVVPNQETAEIYAPISGKVVTVFPTKHAYGIQSEEGIEVLIHIGIDTVNLEGKGFECFVKQGQYVNRGDMLAKCDIARIKEAGFDPTVMAVITNTHDYLDVIPAAKEAEELLYVVLG